MQSSSFFSPKLFENVPAGHGVPLVVPLSQYDPFGQTYGSTVARFGHLKPIGQGTQYWDVLAPRYGLNVPRGQLARLFCVLLPTQY